MQDKPTDLTGFLLQEKQRETLSEDLAILVNEIVHAGLIVSAELKKIGLSDMANTTGNTNVHEDEVIKLDAFANKLLSETLLRNKSVYGFGSEETERFQHAQEQGKYLIFFDPLDGSSNADVNIPTGTIFSIYNFENNLLPQGELQIIAGYLLYGPSTMLVLATTENVNCFTLDPDSGIFFLSHPNLKIPDDGKYYSVNEARANLWRQNQKDFISNLKNGDRSLRYVGSMVADVHRTLLKGGVFLYPSDEENPNGKLRLMFEVNPLSYVVEKAGGGAFGKNKNPLDILPDFLHQKSEVILGSKNLVELYLNT